MAFGLTPTGFQPKQLQDIAAEIQASLNAAFGQNLDFQATTVFGQIVGIFSEREASIWQELEAIYASQYPQGAEGTSVDNILALNNLRRLGATPSVTAPTNTEGTPGLVLFGTPGTVIPAGSLISIPGQPTVQFATDATVTIQPAVTAIQTFFFSNTPNTGAFQFSIIDPSNVTKTFASLPFTSNAAAVQAAINAVLEYAGVTVTGSFTTGFIVTFGGASANLFQNPFVIVANTLQQGASVTNINVVQTLIGAPAEAIASATCTVTGPTFAAAGSLTVIASPVSGWASVNNPLDVIVGTNIENDTEALLRRNTLLAAQANGPIQSIVERVKEVPGVSQALGFENLTQAANQKIGFASVPVTGSFEIVLGASVTAPIPFTATNVTVAAAINALPGLSSVLVTGNFSTGFVLDFNGANGGQPEPLVAIINNTLGVAVTPSFGRPGKSFEIVVEGGDDTAVATTIYTSKPAGIQSYGSTTINVQDSFGNLIPISFSRPSQVSIYVSIVMVTDLTTAPVPEFNPGSIATIQQDIVTIGNAVAIGGLIIGFGSNGLIGAFNNVPGILSYTLFFGESPGPVSNANIQLQSEQIAQFETFLVSISYT